MDLGELDGECEVCFYCERPVATRHEHDHYPTPKECGGSRVVAACINCHDLKDRQRTLEMAHLVPGGFEFFRRVLSSEVTDAGQAEYLVAAHLTHVALGALPPLELDSWEGRLYYAKVLRLAHISIRDGGELSLHEGLARCREKVAA